MATAVVKAIADVDDFNACMDQSEEKVLVIDCHQNWCGPCETVRPTYNSIFNELQDCDNRVLFLTANLNELTPQINELLKNKATDIDLANHGCMPFFLIVKNKAIATTILGADVPQLKESVIAEAPAINKEK